LQQQNAETYVVTTKPVTDGWHILHRESCDDRRDVLMETLGSFEDCAPALERARKQFHPVNACPTCCSACHVSAEELE
jgi:hypothetical protein